MGVERRIPAMITVRREIRFVGVESIAGVVVSSYGYDLMVCGD